ncbi:hypothetical protein CI610_00144 [invertebrate metagenome]|uniref:Uncharacterized protein n=1 Tax=invertebrate metagenome TaxID=1711999 RepID=A0A2H9TCC1_9ZZZZ
MFRFCCVMLLLSSSLCVSYHIEISPSPDYLLQAVDGGHVFYLLFFEGEGWFFLNPETSRCFYIPSAVCSVSGCGLVELAIGEWMPQCKVTAIAAAHPIIGIDLIPVLNE